jgi:outer membrane protein OmpA-like peptidoglycan-associated protein
VKPRLNRHRPSSAAILALSVTALLLLAAPASASHLKGGAVSAAIGADQHLTGHVDLVYASGAPCPAAAGPLSFGSVSISGPSAFSASGPLANASVVTCLPSTKTERADYDVDLSSAPDGTYTVTYSSCCRVTPIANGGSSGTSYTATIQKAGSTVTATPSVSPNVALGVSIYAGYEQSLNASAAGGGPLTFLLLQSATPAQPDYDATAPATNIVSLSSSGQISIPASTTSGLSVGTYYVYKIRVVDAAGNSVEREILLTVSANNVPVLDGPQSPITVMAGGTAELNFTATDADGSQLVTILSAGLPAWATLNTTPGNPAAATISLAPPGDTAPQDVSINVDATDDDGSAPMTSSRALTLHVITVLPKATLGTVPASPSNDPAPQVAFTGEPSGATFECSLDDGAWTACASPWVPAEPLADGPHVLRVRALFSGQTQPDPPSASWRTDTTPPAAPTLTGTPAAGSTETSATIAFTGEPGGAFSCRSDGGPWLPCTSPRRLTGLARGAHSLQVRQADAAGNVGSPATAAWTVAAAAAKVTLRTRAATVTSSSGRPTVGCRAIGGALTSCTVKAYVRVRRHGRTARTRGGRAKTGSTVRVLVGRGRIGAVPAGGSRPVRLTLTRRGRQLLSRVGGVKLELRIAGRAASGHTLRALAKIRVLPQQVRLVTARGTFAGDSPVMLAAGRRFVRRLAGRMQHVRTIVCTGYTDSIGTYAYNAYLALARARTVCDALRARHPNIAVRVRSAGEARPSASNRTGSGRARNRRVVVQLRYR